MNTTQNGTYEDQKQQYIQTGNVPAASDQVKRISLFDKNGDPIKFKRTRVGKIPRAFHEEAKANEWIKKIAEEGPAISKLGFMVATFAENLYAGWTISLIENTRVWLVALIVWGVGAIWETAFGFAWYRTGSDKLAGDQVELNRTMYNRCLSFMSVGLIAAVVSAAFGIMEVLKVWVCIQVIGTVSVLRLQRKIKESHPTEEARQREVDRKAEMQAAWIDEQGQELDLYLEKTAHERGVERKQLAIQTEEEDRVLDSRQYRKQAKENARTRFLTMGKLGGGGNLIQKAKRYLSRN